MSSSISSQIIEKKISDWKWHKIFRFTSYLIKNIKFQDGAGFWYNRCSAGNLNGAVYKGGYYQLKTISITNERGEQHSMMRNNHDDGLIWTTLHNKVWNSLYSNKTLLKFLISSNKNFLMLISCLSWRDIFRVKTTPSWWPSCESVHETSDLSNVMRQNRARLSETEASPIRIRPVSRKFSPRKLETRFCQNNSELSHYLIFEKKKLK